MKRFFAGTLAACTAVMLMAASAGLASTPSRIDLSICPNITTTTYPGVTEGPTACGGGVFSAGSVNIPPDFSSCTLQTNTDLGTFLTTQDPLGAIIHAGAPNSCATHPPTMGVGAPNAAVTVSVVQKGFCPTALTVGAQLGPQAGVVFPIGSLGLGTYTVTATLPAQTVGSQSWLESHATGTLHIGGTFKETDSVALARADNTFAVLLANSFAGPGAGALSLSRAGKVAHITATDFYACGTITLAGSMTYGKNVRGIARLTGSGNITGGTGNYLGLGGTFTLAGSYKAKANRATFVLTGDATY